MHLTLIITAFFLRMGSGFPPDMSRKNQDSFQGAWAGGEHEVRPFISRCMFRAGEDSLI